MFGSGATTGRDFICYILLQTMRRERLGKEKALKFSSKLQSNSADVGENSKAKFFQKLKQFKNSSVSDGKSTLKKSLEQQFDEFLMQKARISYQKKATSYG